MGSWNDWNSAGGGVPTVFFGDNVAHKKHEKGDPWKSAYRMPSKVIRVEGDHKLIRTMSGNWYDSAPVHGWSLLGSNLKLSVALDMWYKRLRIMGVVK